MTEKWTKFYNRTTVFLNRWIATHFWVAGTHFWVFYRSNLVCFETNFLKFLVFAFFLFRSRSPSLDFHFFRVDVFAVKIVGQPITSYNLRQKCVHLCCKRFFHFENRFDETKLLSIVLLLDIKRCRNGIDWIGPACDHTHATTRSLADNWNVGTGGSKNALPNSELSPFEN